MVGQSLPGKRSTIVHRDFLCLLGPFRLILFFKRNRSTPDICFRGSFGGTKTGLPLIGAVPGHKGCWAVLGFGGNGTTYSRIAADIIRSELAGRRDADADLFTLRN